MATSARPLAGGQVGAAARKPRSLWLDAWRRLTRNRAAVLGIVVVVFFIFVAVFARQLAPNNPVEQTGNNSMRPPAWVQTGNPATSGSSANWFGTDTLGRDILSRLIFGTRVSLIVGLIPTIILTIIGVTLGLISGFAGGRTDTLIQRFTEIVAAFPDTLFIISLTVAFRETIFGRSLNGLLLIFVALAITSWVGMSRLVRGQVFSLKEKEFIEAARAIGTPTSSILFRHILPNTLAPIVVSIAFAIPGFVLGEAILSFVGVGMRPSVNAGDPLPTSWGMLLLDGRANLSSGPWMLLFPVLCIALLTLSLTFLGDGLRDALDPRDQ